MTPDRDFVIDALPGHPDIHVALGAAHGFKFASLFGRIAAELAADGASALGPGAVPHRPADPARARPADELHGLSLGPACGVLRAIKPPSMAHGVRITTVPYESRRLTLMRTEGILDRSRPGGAGET